MVSWVHHQLTNWKFDGKLLFCLYLMVLVTTHDAIYLPTKIGVGFLALVGIVFSEMRQNFVGWWLISALLLLDLYYNYHWAANHFWLTLYVAAMFGCEDYFERIGYQPTFNLARCLLMVVFIFAAFHKIHSDYWRSGRLMADYFLNGNSLPMTMEILFPGFHEGPAQNYRQSLQTLYLSGVLGTRSVPINGLPGNFVVFSWCIAWMVIMMEASLAIVFSWKRAFYSQWGPVMMALFLWGTFVFRSEYAFFSLAAILFLMASPHLSKYWQLFFTLSSIIFLTLELVDAFVYF